MTAQPLPPIHLLTVREYARLGEDDHGRTELQEGSLVMSPSPTPEHNIATLELAIQLGRQIPEDLQVVPDIDIDLGLVPEDQPGFSRRPDLIVVGRAARRRRAAEGGLLRAAEVRLVVEVVSPGSRRTDNIVKRAEYADARIPYYWIIDTSSPVSLLACRLTEEFGYVDAPIATGTYRAVEPFPVTLDLDRLS